MKDSYTYFHRGYMNLHFHQQCRRVHCFLHPCQYLLLFVFLMMVILMGVRGNLNVVLICISLMTKDTEFFHILIGHLFYYYFKKVHIQAICLFIDWAIWFLDVIFYILYAFKILIFCLESSWKTSTIL